MEQITAFKGIIYKAYNKITNKVYIGQTTRNLEIRKYYHLYNSKIKEYKFSRALRKYKEKDWEWTVLEIIDINKLNEREEYYINLFDSVNNGYNILEKSSFKGTNNPKYDPTIYELYHPEFGVIKETISQLSLRDKSFAKCFSDLLSGKRKFVKGYVLASNKDNYDQLLKLHEFYNPAYGIVKCKISEFSKLYLSKLGIKYSATDLVSGRIKHIRGWILAKNVQNYDTLVNKSSEITLVHSLYGTKTMSKKEFITNYGLTSSSISCLLSKKYKSSQGWTLPI